VEISINSIQDSGQELLICNILDVTERHEVERLKQEFVSIVSHDLKTPLTAIQNSLYLLGAGSLGSLTERGQQIVNGTQEESQRLVRLVNDLLDMARMEDGRINLECAVLNTDSLVQKSIDVVATLAEKKGIKLDVAPSHFEVLADSDRLIQVLVNFLSNAIKFAPPTSTVRIRCSQVTGAVEFRVIDQGPGIPQEAQRRIFQRFEQVAKEDRTEHGGTGLGLTICKLIVEAHGGSIGVDSQIEQGSSFWFTIPNAAEASAPVIDTSEKNTPALH
jgi:signal transduction histidine kinase